MLPRSVRDPVLAATAATFRTLSALRGRRVFHPDGAAFEATVTISPSGPAYGVPLLDEPGSHPALVRLSRGAGLPEPTPDVIGVAVRLVDVHGDGGLHQDLLLAGSRPQPGLRHLLVPGPGFADRHFSTILPYRVGTSTVIFGARSPDFGPTGTLDEVSALVDRGGLRLDLLTATLTGAWRPLGSVDVHRRLPQQDSDALRFNPWNTGGGMAPVGPFQRMRRAAYPASQSASPR